MGARSVAGVFESMQTADEARRQLLARGVEDGRINVSAPSWDDGVAGEAPGQSYENQPGQGSGGRRSWLRVLTGGDGGAESREARYGEAVRGGACVLSVEARSRQEQKDIAQLLHRHGARRISEHLA